MPVISGSFHIHEDEVGPLLFDAGQRLAPRLRFYYVKTILLQEVLQERAYGGVVVHNEDTLLRH